MSDGSGRQFGHLAHDMGHLTGISNGRRTEAGPRPGRGRTESGRRTGWDRALASGDDAFRRDRILSRRAASAEVLPVCRGGMEDDVPLVPDECTLE